MAKRIVARIANLSKRVGLYHQVRTVYDTLRPSARRQRHVDREIYGSFINRGDLVFDIGANKGQKTAVFFGPKTKLEHQF